MDVPEAIDCLCRWSPQRRRVLDYFAAFRMPDGTRHDAWPFAACALLRLTGRLEECQYNADLEKQLRQVVPAYLASGIISEDEVKAEALRITADLIKWGDSFVSN
jgi:hypothetical protein